MDRLILKSPAKVNLYLDVLRKRPDGYHDIETIFEKIALFDTITIRPYEKGIKVTTDTLDLPTDNRNLAYKAASILFKEADFKGGIWVDIKKRIPIAAGLGGGSSNAATVLSGANRLFRLGFKRNELIELAKRLGADVPLFLNESSFAIGRNRGDEISSLGVYKNLNIWHILVVFNFGSPTPGAYKGLNLRLTHKAGNVKMFARFLLKNDIENLANSLYNRLEEVVLKRFDIIDFTKRLLLEEGALGALLSGSGPTLFGLAKTREEAIAVGRRIATRLGREGRIFVVSTF